MPIYTVKKAFEQFKPGDEIAMNPRQAKYRILSGHLAELAVDTASAGNVVEEPATESDNLEQAGAPAEVPAFVAAKASDKLATDKAKK